MAWHWCIWQNRVFSGSPDCLFRREYGLEDGHTLTHNPAGSYCAQTEHLVPGTEQPPVSQPHYGESPVPHQTEKGATFPPPKLFPWELSDRQREGAVPLNERLRSNHKRNSIDSKVFSSQSPSKLEQEENSFMSYLWRATFSLGSTKPVLLCSRRRPCSAFSNRCVVCSSMSPGLW